MKEINIETILREREENISRLKTEAMEEAKRLANLLRESYVFERLYLFGSTVKDKRYSKNSDIDMAVRGMSEDVYLKAYAFLIRNSTFNIDLKPWEDMTDSIKRNIEREGILL